MYIFSHSLPHPLPPPPVRTYPHILTARSQNSLPPPQHRWIHQHERGSWKRRWCSTRKPERHAHEGQANLHTRVAKSQIDHALSCHVSSIKDTYTKRAPSESDLKFAYGLTLPSRKDMGGGGLQGFFGVEHILQGACTQNCRMAAAVLQIVSASHI